MQEKIPSMWVFTVPYVNLYAIRLHMLMFSLSGLHAYRLRRSLRHDVKSYLKRNLYRSSYFQFNVSSLNNACMKSWHNPSTHLKYWTLPSPLNAFCLLLSSVYLQVNCSLPQAIFYVLYAVSRLISLLLSLSIHQLLLRVSRSTKNRSQCIQWQPKPCQLAFTLGTVRNREIFFPREAIIVSKGNVINWWRVTTI